MKKLLLSVSVCLIAFVCHAQETSQRDTTAVRSEGVISLRAERYAIYPGCEDKQTVDTQKKCFDEKFRKFIHENFDNSIPKKLKLKGKFRMFVAFTVNEEGMIQNIRTRSSDPQFDIELKRILESFPKVKPAVENGQLTVVKPIIPLIFTWR